MRRHSGVPSGDREDASAPAPFLRAFAGRRKWISRIYCRRAHHHCRPPRRPRADPLTCQVPSRHPPLMRRLQTGLNGMPRRPPGDPAFLQVTAANLAKLRAGADRMARACRRRPGRRDRGLGSDAPNSSTRPLFAAARSRRDPRFSSYPGHVARRRSSRLSRGTPSGTGHSGRANAGRRPSAKPTSNNIPSESCPRIVFGGRLTTNSACVPASASSDGRSVRMPATIDRVRSPKSTVSRARRSAPARARRADGTGANVERRGVSELDGRDRGGRERGPAVPK